ncbi:MAG: FAD-binding oxidoreductase [Acidimicrobiales bacterium]
MNSLWFDSMPPPSVRPPLPGPTSVDVVIVGAGYTGLWTAYYLAERVPDASIVVIDAHHVGFGASGRNGGWCISEVAADAERWDALAGPGGGRRMADAMHHTVDEVERVTIVEGIDCDWALGGELYLARNPAQVTRLRAQVSGTLARAPESEARWLDADEARSLCNATKVLGAMHLPQTAALHPGKLVTGLAEACERRGVVIHDDTRATSLSSGVVETTRGRITATSVVMATEAYSRDLEGHKRSLVPLYSLMVATEPLPADVLEEIRLETRPTFADARYRVIYGQRTADGRLAFGGRSAPYRYGSVIDPATESDPGYHQMIIDTLHDLFPVVRDAAITHQWGGVLGVPRNWTPTVNDLGDGVYRAGGYVGEGVAATNLAGRCLAHLIAGAGGADHDRDLTTLPWVRKPSRRWAPEPFRFAAIKVGAELFERADRHEEATGTPAKQAELVWKYLRR